MFTYKRPNEISSTAGESFLAEGPTNEILDVYVSLGVCRGGGVGGCPLDLGSYHSEQINHMSWPRLDKNHLSGACLRDPFQCLALVFDIYP